MCPWWYQYRYPVPGTRTGASTDDKDLGLGLTCTRYGTCTRVPVRYGSGDKGLGTVSDFRIDRGLPYRNLIPV